MSAHDNHDESRRIFGVAGGLLIFADGAASTDLLKSALARSRSDAAAERRLLVLLGCRTDADARAFVNVLKKRRTARSQMHVVCTGGGGERGLQILSDVGVSVSFASNVAEIVAELESYWNSGSSRVVCAIPNRTWGISAAVDEYLGTNLVFDFDKEAEDYSHEVTALNARFRLVSTVGAHVVAATATSSSEPVVPSTVAGMGVIGIGRAAYSGTAIESIYMASPLRTVARGAFYRCSNLERVVLPRTLRYIGRSAFAGCVSLRHVTLPAGLTTIGRKAFRGCSSLRTIHIPTTVSTIGDGAFDECRDLVFSVEQGSYAHDWVQAQGYDHEMMASASPPTAEFRTSICEEDGIVYQLLPGDVLEVRGLRARHGENRLTIPESALGKPVRGLGTGAFTAGCGVRTLVLPPTTTWVSRSAVAANSGVKTVFGRNWLQTVAKNALPAVKSPPPRKPLDADSIHLSLRMVCEILGEPVPASLDEVADVPYRALVAGVLTSGANTLYFGNFSSARSKTVDTLLARGVRSFVSPTQIRDSEGNALPCLLVDNADTAFERVCAWISQQFDATKIALTGSIGKTTTKEMLRLVASEDQKTLYSRGNQNGIAQVGRYIQRLSRDTEVYIQETGAARPGLIESGSRMLQPDAFIITNIGLNHVGNYGGSQDNILKDKASHDDYLPDDGVAFLNFDDPKLRELSLRHRIVAYGVASRDVDYFACDIVEVDGRIEFSVVEASSGEKFSVVVHAFGRHNVSNAVVAFAVGRWLGVPADLIVQGIGSYRGDGLRQNLTELGGSRVLVDCYNASEVAIKGTAEALETVIPDDGGRRIYVVADIDDKLGDVTEEVHRRVGQGFAAQENIDHFVLFGDHMAWAAEEAAAREVSVFHARDRGELESYLFEMMRPEDVIAFKGGQQMALSISIDRLFGSAFVLEDGDVLMKRGTEHERDSVIYRVISEYGAQAKRLQANRDDEHLCLGGYIEDAPLLMVGKSACARSKIRSLEVADPVASIAFSAFFQARRLRTVTLPPSLRVIGRSAFNGCSSLEELDVPDGVTTLGYRAFFACKHLKRVSIPPTVRTIEAEVFSGCSPDLVIECEPGSQIERYCADSFPEISLNTSSGLVSTDRQRRRLP